MSKCISVTVRHVEVDVELEDIDTDDLIEELQGRNALPPMSAIPPLNAEDSHPLHGIYYALKAGLVERAVELTRAHVCDELGVVL